MRRTTALKYAVAGLALAALSIGGASAFADPETEDAAPTAGVNKNGPEGDEHAAFGQARAAEARAQRLEKAAERAAEDDADEPTTEEPEAETETEGDEPEAEEPAGPPAEHTDNGNHGGPNEHAGDHPNENAFEHPAPHEPQGPKDGNGPNEHAGDHPNEHASIGSGNGQGHK